MYTYAKIGHDEHANLAKINFLVRNNIKIKNDPFMCRYFSQFGFGYVYSRHIASIT